MRSTPEPFRDSLRRWMVAPAAVLALLLGALPLAAQPGREAARPPSDRPNILFRNSQRDCKVASAGGFERKRPDAGVDHETHPRERSALQSNVGSQSSESKSSSNRRCSRRATNSCSASVTAAVLVFFPLSSTARSSRSGLIARFVAMCPWSHNLRTTTVCTLAGDDSRVRSRPVAAVALVVVNARSPAARTVATPRSRPSRQDRFEVRPGAQLPSCALWSARSELGSRISVKWNARRSAATLGGRFPPLGVVDMNPARSRP